MGKRFLLAKTCPYCHILKDASEFRIFGSGYYHSECKTCQNTMSNISDMNGNHSSWDHAINSQKLWTEAEIKQLELLVGQGLSRKEIAKTLGRSTQAITVAKMRYLKEQ